MLRRWPIVLAVLYFLGGLAAWGFFMLKVAQELSGLALEMYVLPVSLVGMLIGKLVGASGFIFVPAGLGDPLAHAVFFFPSLALLTYLLGWRMPALYRKMMAD
jgi:hypothetical protein